MAISTESLSIEEKVLERVQIDIETGDDVVRFKGSRTLMVRKMKQLIEARVRSVVYEKLCELLEENEGLRTGKQCEDTGVHGDSVHMALPFTEEQNGMAVTVLERGTGKFWEFQFEVDVKVTESGPKA